RDVRYACFTERRCQPPGAGPPSRIHVEHDPDTDETNRAQLLSKLIEDERVRDCPFTRTEANRGNIPVGTSPDARFTVDDVEDMIVVGLQQEQGQRFAQAVGVCFSPLLCPLVLWLLPVDELQAIDAQRSSVLQCGPIVPHDGGDTELAQDNDGELAL